MAKSARTGGEGRGRRVADRRRAAQPEGIAPEQPAPATADDRVTAALADAPTREAIARRAYELFTARGGTHGYDIEDWLQAERELRRK